MTLAISAYAALSLAIVLEVVGTTFLQQSQQFTRPLPTVMMALCYGGMFYFMTLALRSMPLGIVYAIWSGMGIVLVSVIGWLVFRQTLDLAALLGMSMILGGVVVIHLFSNAAPH